MLEVSKTRLHSRIWKDAFASLTHDWFFNVAHYGPWPARPPTCLRIQSIHSWKSDETLGPL